MSFVCPNCSSTSIVSTADRPPPPYSVGNVHRVEAERLRLLEDRPSPSPGRARPVVLDLVLERDQFRLDEAANHADDHRCSSLNPNCMKHPVCVSRTGTSSTSVRVRHSGTVARRLTRSRAIIRRPAFERVSMHVLFEDDGQLQGRHGPRRQRRVAAGRGRVRQAPQDQGRRRCCCASPSLRRRRSSPRRRSSRASSTRISCGKCAATTSSASTISRASTTATRRRRPRPPPSRSRWHAAPMYFYKRGKGRYRKAPPDALKAALASVERKKREARADRRVGRRAARAPAARGAAREAADAALQAGQERARMEGAAPRRATRRRRIPSRCSPSAARSRRRTTTTTTRFLAEAFPAGRRVPAVRGAAARCPSCRCRRVRAFSIDDAHDDRDRRRVLGARARRTAITRSASTSPRRRSRSRADRRSTRIARARLSTVYMPGRKITMLPDEAVARVHAGRRAHRRPRCRCTRKSAPDGALVRHETRVESRADRRQPAPRRRSAKRSRTTCRRRPIRRGRRSCACCGSSRSRSSAQRGKADIERIDYNFYVDWDAAPDGRVTHRRRARAAARSTSSSPS